MNCSENVHFEELLQKYLANGKDQTPKQTQINKIKAGKSMSFFSVKKTSALQSSNKYKYLYKLSSWIYQKAHIAHFHPNYK